MTKREADAFIVTKDDGSWDVVGAGVLEKYAIKADVDADGSKQIMSDGWDYGTTLLEPLYDPEQLAELLELNTYHAQCCDVVARDAGGLGWTLNPMADKKGANTTKQRIVNFIEGIHPGINTLLYQRNYDRRSMGYGVLELIREGRSKSEPKTLSHIPAQHLRRHNDGVRVKQMVAGKTVWFIIYGKNVDEKGKKYDVHCDSGDIYPYNSLRPEQRANELLWRMDYTPKSHYYGLSKVVPAIRAIYGDMSRSDYNISFFKNYGMPAFAVMVSGDFEDYDKTPEDPDYDVTKTLKYKISQQIKEVMKNPHSAVTILVPSEGEEGNVQIELKPLSIETKEASFRLFRKDNRDEILTAHRVPGYRIGINETGALGGSNTDEATKIYKASVIEPLRADDAYDINLLIKEEFQVTDWQFAVTEIDQRDYLNDLNAAEKLFNMAAMTPKQIIEYFGERFGLETPSNPYLDEYYLQGKPLDSVWETGGVDPPGVDTVLDNLENDIMEVEDEPETPEDGDEGAAVKNAAHRFADRISNAIRSRKGPQW